MSYGVRLALCVGGIMGAFLCYGLVQEKIMTTAYGTDESGADIYFTYSAFLVLNNRLIAIAGALLLLALQKESFKNAAPLYTYFGISIANVSSTYCQYEALKWISFPTQTLGKCGKMIPVMILGMLISGKKYTWKDYAIALGITIGCTLFLLTGDISDKSGGRGDTPIGLFLMAGYLFTDGFTSTFQERLFRGYKMSTYNQMLYVNIASSIISFIILIAQGTLFASFQFALTYPQLLFDAFILSLCSLAGRTVIYYTIKTFGALIFSTIMTTRQFVAILLSCAIFLHPLSTYQWLATAIVFATLYYKTAQKRKRSPAPPADIEGGARK
eukprot:TRINITY_DN11518_c0_g1_i1.p1 TRINITY_DN11518_c0_g1~~TRINITY_DN11518_c0_g1_i1.p1  ORF type:complete len:353 (-),score=28.56 TRINITY_DN11518_c0_g1_i1:68-1051(-)